MPYKFVQYIFYPALTAVPFHPYGLPAPYTLLEEARFRAAHMVKVLNYAHDTMPHQVTGQKPVTGFKDTDVLKVFVAPEFFFRSAYGKRDGSGHYSLYEVQAAREVIRDAVMKDGRFDDWFILPGTAIYRQQRANRAKAPVIFNEAWAITRATATASKVEVTCQKQYFSDADDLDDTKAAMNATSPLRALTRRVDHQIVDVRGTRIAFEICLDHYYKAVRRTVTAAPMRPLDVDIHVLSSCGMETIPGSVTARRGGFFLRCNGNDYAPPRVQFFHIGGWPGGGVPSENGVPMLNDLGANLYLTVLPDPLQIYGPGVDDTLGYSDTFALN